MPLSPLNHYSTNKVLISKANAGQLLNLQTHPSHKHSYIIELMKKFELCYELDDKITLLVPDLLPVEEPEFTVDKAIRFIFEYRFLPKTIIARFIVKMHHDIKQELRWCTGVVIEDVQFAATAVIKVDEDARQIFIDVNGTQKREYFAAILHTFRAIHQLFAKLDVSEFIRLVLPSSKEKLIDYQELVQLEQQGVKDYPTVEKIYSISEILGSVRTENQMDEMLAILQTLSKQVVTKADFLEKSEEILQKMVEQANSEEELETKLNKVFMLKPNFFGIGIDLNEFVEEIRKIKCRW